MIKISHKKWKQKDKIFMWMCWISADGKTDCEKMEFQLILFYTFAVDRNFLLKLFSFFMTDFRIFLKFLGEKLIFEELWIISTLI